MTHLLPDRFSTSQPGRFRAPSDLPLFTVALCTEGLRPTGLPACLRSLRKLNDPNFEIVCVDNSEGGLDPEDVTGLGARYVREARRGLDFARNRAIAEARGEFIAFIDDDCEADPRWLGFLRRSFADADIACVTGRVGPASQLRREERWFEQVCSFDRGPRAQRFKVNERDKVLPHQAFRLGTGCNMAFRRDVFERIGDFDPSLDMGTIVGGGGDLDIFARLLNAGHGAAYNPHAFVRHHHRSTRRSLYQQLFGYGRTVGALSFKFVLSHPLRAHHTLRSQLFFVMHVARVGMRRIRRPSTKHLPVSLSLLMLLGNLLGPAAYVLAIARTRASERVTNGRPTTRRRPEPMYR